MNSTNGSRDRGGRQSIEVGRAACHRFPHSCDSLTVACWRAINDAGVHWDKGKRKWGVLISLPGRPSSKKLGYFDNEMEAAKAYDR